MEIFSHVSWLGVFVGWFISFALGAVWFSPLMFLKKWNEGLGTMAVKGRSLPMLLVVQAICSFLFAIVLAIALGQSLVFAVLVGLMVAGMVKSYCLYAGQTLAAVTIQSSYVVVQAAIIIAAVMILS